MTTVAEAIDALGLHERDGYEAIIVRPHAGTWEHFRLADCLTKPVNGDIYVASGLFKPGTVTRYEGRKGDNVAQILWLPFDFDLYQWLGCVKEDVWALPQTAIDDLIVGLQKDVEEVFAVIGLPIHRLDYTGYGLAVAINVPPHKPESVAEIKALHKRIVQRINRVARQEFADPEVSDAGTRGMRLVPCTNTKGEITRQTRTIYRYDGVVTEDILRAAAGETNAPPTRVIPNQGQAFDADTERQIVEAVRPQWTMGNRHHPALALAGLFAKAGVPEEQTQRIVERLCDVAGGDSKDTQKAVHTSYERVRSGLQVQGFTAIRNVFPNELTDWLDQLAVNVRQANAPRLVIEATPHTAISSTTDHVKRNQAWTDPPKEAFFGWLGDYLALVEPTTEAPDAFHLGSGLTLAGAMIGRRVHVRYAGDTLYGNLFTVLIGPSGSSRKDTAIKRALAVPQMQKSANTFVKPVFDVSRDVSSAEGLVTILKEQPNTLLYLTELSALMANARRKATRTILDKLIEAWDTPHRLQNLNKQSPQTADNPYLSIVAATQPGRLAAEMTDEDIHSGFANRWLYMVGVGKAARPRPPAVDEAAAWRLYLDLKHVIESYGDGRMLTLLPEVGSVWDDWYVRQHEDREATEEEAAMRVRHATLIQKVALIYAVSEGADAIGLKHIEPAMALVDWMWGNVKQMMKEWGVHSDTQLQHRIETVLSRKGEMKRWQLQAACSNRKWTGPDFTRVLDAAIKNGSVVMPAPGIVALNAEM